VAAFPTSDLYDAIAPIYDEWQSWRGITPFARVAESKLAQSRAGEAPRQPMTSGSSCIATWSIAADSAARTWSRAASSAAAGSCASSASTRRTCSSQEWTARAEAPSRKTQWMCRYIAVENCTNQRLPDILITAW